MVHSGCEVRVCKVQELLQNFVHTSCFLSENRVKINISDLNRTMTRHIFIA